MLRWRLAEVLWNQSNYGNTNKLSGVEGAAIITDNFLQITHNKYPRPRYGMSYVS